MRRRISSAVLVMISGSRNSSTNRIVLSRTQDAELIWRNSVWLFANNCRPCFFQAVALDLVHCLFSLSKHGKRAHLLQRIFFADFGHGKAYMNKDPVTGPGHIILQQPKVDFAPNPNHLHSSQSARAFQHINNFSRYGQTHCVLQEKGNVSWHLPESLAYCVLAERCANCCVSTSRRPRTNIPVPLPLALDADLALDAERSRREWPRMRSQLRGKMLLHSVVRR